MNDKNRKIWIDYINCIACICVVAMHCNGSFWSFHPSESWALTVFIETLCYWAVPAFFMLTGINLIDYKDRYDTKQYYIARIKRVVIPYLIWTAICILYFNRNNISALNIRDVVNIYINGSMPAYWFFIPLFAIYFSIPVIGFVKSDSRKNVLLYMTIIAFITCSIFPLICECFSLNYNNDIAFPICCGYLIYPILGYLVVNYYEFSRRQRIYMYIYGLISLLIRMGTLIFVSLKQGSMFSLFNGYLRPTTIVYSLSILIFFKYEIARCKYFYKFGNVISKLSKLSFGVYLIHMLVIDIVHGILRPTSLYWNYLAPIPIYAICCVVVFLFSKNVILKKIFGL